MLAALGVVYGDIGTSPLYALRECFHHVAVEPANVLGILSLIIWTLVLMVCVKYLGFILRADNRGEGGVLALVALAGANAQTDRRRWKLLMAMGIFGAALLYGDGAITPCITVLGAVEGLEVATPHLRPFIVPLTLLILVLLFAFQRVGTARVGKVFGPVMVVWFVTLAALGVRGIAGAPAVLEALSPLPGLRFLAAHGLVGFSVMGSVFLVVTGAEALYADLGHFGASPIRRVWFSLVFPSLVLNYLGQGALLLRDASALENPFYLLAPGWSLYPMVVLATLASVIASQALISGAYSITMQAIQLGYLPRMEIRHTSSEERGQIYLPVVNSLLLAGCLLLVLGFQNSSRLASAYGIAVTLTMLVTTGLFAVLARRTWRWSLSKTALVCSLFLAVELVFFGANALKILHGGWVPLFVAAAIFAVMTTWRTGRRLLGGQLSERMLPLEMLLESARAEAVPRVPGTAVYMAGNPRGTPIALLHNLKHNRVLHERVILMTIVTEETPHADPAARVKIETIEDGIFRVVARYGFMEKPDIEEVARGCAAAGLPLKPAQATFFLSRETIVRSTRAQLSGWRRRIFAFLARNAQTATDFFGLPPNRVVELGMQVAL